MVVSNMSKSITKPLLKKKPEGTHLDKSFRRFQVVRWLRLRVRKIDVDPDAREFTPTKKSAGACRVLGDVSVEEIKGRRQQKLTGVSQRRPSYHDITTQLPLGRK